MEKISIEFKRYLFVHSNSFFIVTCRHIVRRYSTVFWRLTNSVSKNPLHLNYIYSMHKHVYVSVNRIFARLSRALQSVWSRSKKREKKLTEGFAEWSFLRTVQLILFICDVFLSLFCLLFHGISVTITIFSNSDKIYHL